MTICDNQVSRSAVFMCQSCVLNSEVAATENLHSAIDSAVLLSSGSSDPQACGAKRQVPTTSAYCMLTSLTCILALLQVDRVMGMVDIIMNVIHKCNGQCLLNMCSHRWVMFSLGQLLKTRTLSLFFLDRIMPLPVSLSGIQTCCVVTCVRKRNQHSLNRAQQITGARSTR